MDNWEHRSEKMKCTTCMWFVPKKKKKKDQGEEHPATGSWAIGLGRCRRHAPTMAGFPAVFGTDWCGDHKLDENAV